MLLHVKSNKHTCISKTVLTITIIPSSIIIQFLQYISNVCMKSTYEQLKLEIPLRIKMLRISDRVSGHNIQVRKGKCILKFIFLSLTLFQQ